MTKQMNWKHLFLVELKYQFSSPIKILVKLSGVLMGLIILIGQIISENDPFALLTLMAMAMGTAIFFVELYSIIQNLQGIDQLKTQFLIYKKQQVIFVRFLNEVINILFTALMMLIISLIVLAVKVDASSFPTIAALMTKQIFPSIAVGLVLAYFGTWVTTIKASIKVKKLLGAIAEVLIYLILVVIGYIIFPLSSNLITWVTNNSWILALPFFGIFLAGTFIFTSSITWIYALLSLVYVLIFIALTFKYYTHHNKLSLLQN